MPSKKALVKSVQHPPIRLTEEQNELLVRAAARRAQDRGELVSTTEIIREGALRLAREILQAA